MLPENWDVVLAFLAVQTQWRVGPGGYVGLDYPAARSAVKTVIADGLGLRKRGRRLRWKHVFPGLCEMEGAVLKELASRAEKRGAAAPSRR